MKQSLTTGICLLAGLIYGIGTVLIFLPLQVPEQFPIQYVLYEVGTTMLGVPGIFAFALANELQPQSPPLKTVSGSITVIFPANIWHYVLAVIAGLLVGIIVYRFVRWLMADSRFGLVVVCIVYFLQVAFVAFGFWFIAEEDFNEHNIPYPPAVTRTCERQLETVSIRLIDYGNNGRTFMQTSQDQGKSWQALWLLSGSQYLTCDDFYEGPFAIWGRDQNTLLFSTDGGSSWLFWNPSMIDPQVLKYGGGYNKIESVQFESPTQGQIHLVPLNDMVKDVGNLDLQTEDGGIHWSVAKAGAQPYTIKATSYLSAYTEFFKYENRALHTLSTLYTDRREHT